jgi:transitional endoplasmic reticulum ATPase
LVRALARELEYWHVFEVNASDVLQNPRKFRDTVELAANHRPAIIFLDEADELLRERVHSNSASATNEILKCMDGMMGKIPEIVFMAATNNAELMDAAALRGGRFSEKIYMGRLTGRDLVDFLEKDFASKTKVQFAANLTPELLATRLKEAAPSDAIGILRKAINYTFGQSGEVRSVCMEDIDKAIVSMQL